MSFTEAALLREVARIQHDKTMLMVRDAIDSLATTTYNNLTYSHEPRSAVKYRDELLSALRGIEGE